jgi:hypothetical protein
MAAGVVGIGLLTDADDTGSRSIGDKADFQTLPPGPLITTHP